MPIHFRHTLFLGGTRWDRWDNVTEQRLFQFLQVGQGWDKAGQVGPIMEIDRINVPPVPPRARRSGDRVGHKIML
jgi:hypothetical protein